MTRAPELRTEGSAAAMETLGVSLNKKDAVLSSSTHDLNSDNRIDRVPPLLLPEGLMMHFRESSIRSPPASSAPSGPSAGSHGGHLKLRVPLPLWKAPRVTLTT